MENFGEFILELLKQFFGSLWSIISGIFSGLFGMFNIGKYINVFKAFSSEFNFLAWLFAIIFVLLLIAALGGIGFAIYLLARKYIRVRKTLVEQEELLNEVGRLNKGVED